jgi:phospholipase/carboxylesterase
MSQPKRRASGPLSAIEFQGEQAGPAVVLFHGYGADAADLAPLAVETRTKRRLRWLFPDAPLRLDFGGRAWFPIDVAAIEAGQMSGKPVDWSGTEPSGLSAAREAASAFLGGLGLPWEDLILGGFSQGAILAADLALRAKRSPRGLVILSGNLVNDAQWRKLAPARAGLPFFQSHGITDPILGYQGARRLTSLLKEGGLEGELLSFEGGHSIPTEVLDSLAAYLDRAAKLL